MSILVLFALFLWVCPIKAASPLDRFPALMDTLVGGHYAAAERVCSTLAQEHPDHPASLHARASVRYAHMIDFEDTVGRAEFMSLTETCRTQCHALKRQGRGNRAELAYLAASSLASRALLLSHEGKQLPALRLFILAKSEFDDALEADPEFYDAYLGRGAYRYAVATHARLINWLPFVPSAESGWQDMWLAVERSRFSKYSALTSLVWFALDRKDYALTDSICRAGLERFPDSRGFLWPKLALEFRQGHWAEAMLISENLLRQYLASPDNNGYETINLLHKLMVCADSLGLSPQAEAYAREGLATYRTEDVARRREGKLNEMRSRLASSNSRAARGNSP